AAGAATIAVVFATEPTAKRSGAVRQTPMLVDVVEVARGTHRPTLVAMGTVEAAEDVVLRPRVAGQVVARAPAFTPGGFVSAGQTLLRIDPADYETILQQRLGELHQAEADLQLEMGRQNVAQLDYEVLAEDLGDQNEALVLREPQLLATRARVEAARAAVRRAELDLERTRITVPFDAHVLSREVAVGSQVAAGEALGRLVGVDHYWVVATVQRSERLWIGVPASPDGRGSPVEIHDRAAWPAGVIRTGHVTSEVGALDDRTRMARLLVTVPDPLARDEASGDMPALTLGAFVEARITGREIADVVRLPRDLIRQDDTVWVMRDEQLEIRDVDIVLRDDTHAYVRSGLEDGDLVVTTNLATVRDGAPLRLTAEQAMSADDEATP
ncbi:efflux RND transporter periplasmic adaptor subunit, partial [bacterium]|nr:efflux RND transporter periplasmic adaptor subunit [bacterium]